LVRILIILVVGAAFGFFDWNIVGSFERLLVYFTVGGFIIVAAFFPLGS